MAAGMLSFAPLGALAAGTTKTRDTTIVARPNAHGKVSGKIVKLTADSIEIKGHKGAINTFAITGETKYGSKQKVEKYANFKNGERVQIHFAEENGKQVAVNIQETSGRRHSKI